MDLMNLHSNASDIYDNGTDFSMLGYNSSEDFYIPYDQRPETYFVPVLFFLIFVVGCLGNGTLVIIFLRHRTMRNVPNTYIFSLALADLLVIITSVPFTSIIYTLESWPWGVSICKISETAKDISIGVSVFTLTALSADRFFAIVDPLKKFHTSSGGKKATRITVATAVAIWLLAVLCAMPALVGSHIKAICDEDGSLCIEVCYPFPEHWMNEAYPQVMVMAKFLVLYIIPLFIIFGFYLSMAISLIMSTRNVPGELQGMHRQIKARKKVAVTVLIFVAVFAICFAPLHAFMLFFYFTEKAQDLYNPFWHYLRIVGFCLCYINSCVNPVALYFVSGAFRKHFNRYLLCKKMKRNRCNTCTGQQATSMSLVSTKRQQSINRRPTMSINRKVVNNAQETSITLLGNGHGDPHICNKII
ncbi:neuropeptide CCHamide-1 receptor [Dendroctonus ponderosae]|uniref:G-protein coupled receptors family 1 profile domain-containing protein n=2 Tax=Dendroctonus ponderosae TaxID=77166 RepID=A0AAR5PD55_DENPD|nr:neuropeptide CCHamide-1 receptor [Dendroctonus ponderosae]XP_048519892.1 neuropeptide CCHamide-1 receptor [Dendroctonus ponderosae]